MSLLSLEGVRSGYGRMEVLHGVDLSLDEGEIVSLIGANGAGKTTILNTICGIVRTSDGHIRYDGHDVTHRPTQELVRLGIAQVPEGRKLFQDLTVLENLEIGAYLRRDGKAVRDDLEQALALFPALRERLELPAGSLSGGEQQMCAMARGLMAKPRLLLLDEPSLGLAPLLVEQIFRIVRRLHEGGTTLLLVEQNARLALEVSQRGYVLETGSITMEGDAKELLADPRVRSAYLGDA